ncbi:hypothetical protein FS749_008792 [Ceratobasidium sp. UAMH 11750]|nr:hypothetical protein FS749_008792 [Ceratobasidium sp. UAMH 11750]
MGRLHFSSSPKYIVKQEPVCEDLVFATWADQAFDPEAEVLSGHVMVYEAFLDRDGRPPLPDDGDASEINSESSSSAATEDLEEYPPARRSARERLAFPSSPTLSTQSVELTTNEFDDFVRVEAPPSDSITATPAAHSVSVVRPSSPLRQSVTSTSLDELPDHPPSDTPEVVLQRGDEERLFAYYQSYTVAPPERERPHYSRGVPRVEHRPWPTARRIPGNPRFLPPTASRIGEAQRTPLANTLNTGAHQPRPRSASFSEVIAAGTRAPERWLAAVDGTVISNHVLAHR